MSPLLVRIEEQLSRVREPVERAELLAKKACVLARQGQGDHSRTIVADLRKVFGDGRSGRTTVWIMLAEGLIHRYGNLSPQAMDRITRAQVLSIAMGYGEAIATISAWKALLELDFSAYDSMFASLTLSVGNAELSNHDAWTRIALNIFSASSICGESQIAQAWFKRARHHAIECGDQTSIEALQYNRVAFELGRLRALLANGQEIGEATRAVRREYMSAHTLRALTNVTALESYLYLCDARLSILEEDYALAIEKIERVHGTTPFTEHNYNIDVEGLEITYCLAKLGRVEDAVSRFSTVNVETLVDLVIDDQLIAAWLLYEMALIDPRFGDKVTAEFRLHELRVAYSNTMNSLKQQLMAYSVPPPLTPPTP